MKKVFGNSSLYSFNIVEKSLQKIKINYPNIKKNVGWMKVGILGSGANMVDPDFPEGNLICSYPVMDSGIRHSKS